MTQEYTGDEVVRPLEKLIKTFANPRGYDIDKVFTGLLDYIIWQLDPMGSPIEFWQFKEGEGKVFHEMMQCVCEILQAEIPKRGWYDVFGDLFMSLHRAGNSKGQFFTPPSVCNMLAQANIAGLQEDKVQHNTRFGKRLTVSDPAAGSSRILLAAGVGISRMMQNEWGYDEVTAFARRPYLCAEDIDFNCVKMSAINIALHGYFGEAVCHDTLCEPAEVRMGYIINETMYPFPTNIPSIRKEMRPECFVATRSMIIRQEKQEQQQTVEAEHKSDTKPLSAPAETKPVVAVEKKRVEPQQLSLWDV